MQLELTEKQMDYIDNRDRILVVEGSAGSGKTYFAVIKMLYYCLTHRECMFLMGRKTLPSLKRSCLTVLRKVLSKYHIKYEENKADGFITFDNGSTIMYMALDEMEKVRSITVDGIYLEQAEELSEPLFYELLLRMRGEWGQLDYSQCIVVLQPTRKSNWAYQYFHIKYKDECTFVHFSYKENDFLPEESKQFYDDLEFLDPRAYKMYTEGLWISESGLILTNWDTDVDRSTFKYYTGGIDFGFTAPSSFVLCGWYDDECYVLDEVYEKGLDNNQLSSRISECLARNGLSKRDVSVIYADSASPDRISMLCKDGFNVQPSVKNVDAKIQTAKLTSIHVDGGCENLIRELSDWAWDTDQDGNPLDVPVKKNDHAIDALLYCIYGVRGELSVYKPATSIDLSEVYIY